MDRYYSQHRQDQFVNEYVLQRKHGGVFVEIGAFDGVTYSNSLFFERHMGWTGICVEPIPAKYQELQHNRSCICVNACVSSESGMTKFLWIDGYSEMLSGISSSYEPQHLERIKDEVKMHACAATEIEVPSLTFSELLANNHIQHVDYCSIDVEGAELSIVSDLKLAGIKPVCFTVENNYNDSSVRRVFRESGYGLIGKLGCDELYVRTTFARKWWLRMRLKVAARKQMKEIARSEAAATSHE